MKNLKPRSSLLTCDDIDVKFDRVYKIDDEEMVITRGDKYTIVGNTGNSKRCFFPYYFQLLMELGRVTLLETGQPNG